MEGRTDYQNLNILPGHKSSSYGDDTNATDVTYDKENFSAGKNCTNDSMKNLMTRSTSREAELWVLH